MAQIKYINLADLNLPKFQAHTKTSQELIQEISESIKSIGVLEPLLIRDTDHGLEIVAGCVRYRASILAGLKAVPCINMSLDRKAAEMIKLHENIKRISLDHIDQGLTFLMMKKELNMTDQQISESVGKSCPYISQHISLALLDNEITQAVKENRISFSQARELMRVDNKTERNRLLQYCENEGATIRVLRGWVEDFLRYSSPPPSQESQTTEQKYDYNDPHIFRFCEACDKSVEISKIRQVFYCPECHHAIKTAILEEKQKNSSNTPKKTPPEAPK